MKKVLSTISVLILSLLFVSIPVSGIYTLHHPNEGIVISKRHYKGGSFDIVVDSGMEASGFVCSVYRVTVVNTLRATSISVSKDEFESIKKWRKYKAKRNLRMYN
jgi:hypothetical protein